MLDAIKHITDNTFLSGR